MVDLINYTKYFESPLERHFYINEELLHNKNVIGIRTGRDDSAI